MNKFRCKLKTRKRIEAEIPSNRWGWWKDVCPGKELILRRATASDVRRCHLSDGDKRGPNAFFCEIGEDGALVSKESIDYVKVPPDYINAANARSRRRFAKSLYTLYERSIKMIKVPETQHFLINVKLKSGEFFESKDITNSPMGEHERWVSFWEHDKIRAYPACDVEYYELIPQTDNK